MIGVAGSGKSTLARRLFKSTEILSSDHYRAVLSDREETQDVSADVFWLIRWLTERRLSRGLVAVVDATNVDTEKRQPFVELAHRQNASLIAIVLDYPIHVAHSRNTSRARVVPRDAIDLHHEQLRDTLRALHKETSKVYVLKSPHEAEQINIIRSAHDQNHRQSE
jgi:protein phosphatase